VDPGGHTRQAGPISAEDDTFFKSDGLKYSNSACKQAINFVNSSTS
jgi:hypothetical protein